MYTHCTGSRSGGLIVSFLILAKRSTCCHRPRIGQSGGLDHSVVEPASTRQQAVQNQANGRDGKGFRLPDHQSTRRPLKSNSDLTSKMASLKRDDMIDPIRFAFGEKISPTPARNALDAAHGCRLVGRSAIFSAAIALRQSSLHRALGA
jgi:hypothetical protein